jgi:hypothetical protein
LTKGRKERPQVGDIEPFKQQRLFDKGRRKLQSWKGLISTFPSQPPPPNLHSEMHFEHRARTEKQNEWQLKKEGFGL